MDANRPEKASLLYARRFTVNLISTAKGVTKEEFAKRFAKWRAAMNAASETNDGSEAARERFQKIHNQRTEFMNEDRTGFVWLYLRKQ